MVKDQDRQPQGNTLSSLQRLPDLKATIKIIDGGFDFWQDRVWILTDVLSGKHYYLGRIEHEIISHWYAGTVDDIVAEINTSSIYKVTSEQVENVIRFLAVNNLLQVGSEVKNKFQKNKQKLLQSFLKSASKVFYYKLPLVKPDRFLEATKYIVKPLFSLGFFYFICMIFAANIYLLAGSWGSFSGELPSVTSFSSVILILATLIITKVVHELGHAYACRLSDCSVPEIGVTFIFFYPLLYTDVSNSILLNAKERLLVSTAGIRMELYLAIIAGFAWFFVDPGTIVKNLLFFVAVVSWFVSIVVNIMPFIKFDGYYILSDFLRIRNLSIRSNAVFKYYLRRYVFGIDAIMPESYSKGKYRFLLFFTLMTGVYRVFLFTSILLFLYYIELLGIGLFILGIATLLLIPFTREIYNIWLLREKMIYKKNIFISLALLLTFLVVFFMPMGKSVNIPAVLYANSQRVYTPFETKLDKVNLAIGKEYKKGDGLMILSNPRLTTEKIINILNLKSEQYYSSGALLSDKTRKARAAKQSDIAYQRTIGDNIDVKQQQLIIKAPFKGRITAVKDDIYIGSWLENKTWLFDMVDYNTRYIQAFITAEELNDIKDVSQYQAFFIPDRLDVVPCMVNIKSISKEPVSEIPQKPQIPLSLAESFIVNSNLLLFAANFGGFITLADDRNNNWVPIESFFTLDLVPDVKCSNNTNQILKGVVKIKGLHASLANRTYNKIKKLFLQAA